MVGSYTIGKERIYLSAAQIYNVKVCVDYHKMRVLKCQALDKEIQALLTTNEKDARIHVTSITKLTMAQLTPYLKERTRFTRIVALKPSTTR